MTIEDVLVAIDTDATFGLRSPDRISEGEEPRSGHKNSTVEPPGT